MVPSKGIHLSEYKAHRLHSNEAINSTGSAGYRRTNHIFCQALAWKNRFTICSNKYVKSNVKHQKHLSELLEIMRLLFRGLHIMKFPSRTHKSPSLPHPHEKSWQHRASPCNADVGRSSSMSLDMCHRTWLQTLYKKLHGMLSENWKSDECFT